MPSDNNDHQRQLLRMGRPLAGAVTDSGSDGARDGLFSGDGAEYEYMEGVEEMQIGDAAIPIRDSDRDAPDAGVVEGSRGDKVGVDALNIDVDAADVR